MGEWQAEGARKDREVEGKLRGHEKSEGKGRRRGE